MENRETVQLRTDNQFKDIAATLLQAIPSLSFNDAQRIISNKSAFSKEVRSVFAQYAVDVKTEEALRDWQAFYKNVFGINIDVGRLKIPRTNENFTRLLVISKKLSADQIVKTSRRFFPCEPFVCGATQRSLDEWFPIEEYRPAGDYAAWTADNRDPERPGASKLEVTTRRSHGAFYITLREFLLFQLKYFLETHLQLAELFPTVCVGTRERDSDVSPRVDFHGLQVNFSRSESGGYTRTVGVE